MGGHLGNDRGKKPHTQTLARIIDKLAKSDVDQTKRRGKKLVIVDPEAADRYYSRCNRETEQPSATSVMS